MEHLNKYCMFTGTAHMDFRITIITGVCRSGKTLLGQLLGSMHNVEHIDEPWIAMILPVIQGKGLMNQEVSKTLLRSFTEELFNDVILLRRANFRPSDLSSIWTCKSTREIFSRLVNLQSRDDVRRYVRENNSMLLYNLAGTLPFISFFNKTFPNCKIIHVVRNGLDVASETVKKKWFSDIQLKNPLMNDLFREYQRIDGKYYLPWWIQEEDKELFLNMNDFARGLCYWRTLLELSQKQIMELRESHSQIYREVKYEELIQNPKQVLKEISIFLEISPSEKTGSVLSTIEDRTSFDLSDYPIDHVPRIEMERVIKMLEMFNYSTEGL